MAEEHHLEGAGEGWTPADFSRRNMSPESPSLLILQDKSLCTMGFRFRKNPEAYTFQSICGPQLAGRPHKDLGANSGSAAPLQCDLG